MSDILQWLGEYSLPVVALILLGAALLYLLKLVTEKAIAHQFDHYSRSIELQLQRRSNFEERILLDRYALLRELYAKTNAVLTNVNRMRSGTRIEGFERDGDIVPLTEIFEAMAVNRYLIPSPLHDVLHKLANLALELANARSEEDYLATARTTLETREEFDRLMTQEFRLNQIGGLE